MENVKQRFLCTEDLSLINSLIELDIKDRKSMIEAIQSAVKSEDVQKYDILQGIDKRVVEAFKSLSDEEVDKMIASYPLSSDDIRKFAY